MKSKLCHSLRSLSADSSLIFVTFVSCGHAHRRSEGLVIHEATDSHPLQTLLQTPTIAQRLSLPYHRKRWIPTRFTRCAAAFEVPALGASKRWYARELRSRFLHDFLLCSWPQRLHCDPSQVKISDVLLIDACLSENIEQMDREIEISLDRSIDK